MKGNNKSTQQGFVLVTVMLLTMMAGTVVLTSLKDSTVQERLSGNFQKKINSRMMAEKGVYDAINEMKTEIAAADSDATVDEIRQMLEGKIANSVNDKIGEYTTGTGKYVVELAPNGSNEIIITSTGTLYEGQTRLQGIFALEGGAPMPEFPYAKGITGCEEVTVSGSGKIDSYDSSLGDYDINSNKSENVTVRTLLEGEMKFTGAADIDGDLIAADSVTFVGSANISGNLHSNGNLILKGNSKIGGNASTRGSYEQSSGSIGGTVHANGDITLSQTKVDANVISRQSISITGQTIGGYLLALNNIALEQPDIKGGASTHANYTQKGGVVYGGVRAIGNVSLTQWGSVITGDDLRYAGQGAFTGDTPEYMNTPYHVDSAPYIAEVPVVEEVLIDDGSLDPSDPNDISCDPYNIANEVQAVDDKATTAKDLDISGSHSGDIYVLNSLTSAFTINNGSSGSPSQDITATPATFMGQNFNVLMFDNVTIKGHLKVAEGEHVVMYVKGDFKMLGASSLTIPNESSLTLIIQGDLDIGAGGQVYTPDHGVTSVGLPVFAIYSSYVGDGIKLSGGTEEIYAAIYAPLTDVTVTSGVAFKGSIHGNSVEVSGAGGVHYDTALTKAGLIPGDAGVPKLVFKGWRFL